MKRLDGTDKGSCRFSEMEKITMDDVCLRIETLLKMGYDIKPPKDNAEEDILLVNESCFYLIDTLYQENRMKSQVDSVRTFNSNIYNLLLHICNTFVPYLAAVPLGQDGRKKLSLKKQISDLLFSLSNEQKGIVSDVYDTTCAIDSEEEDRLFEELDYLVDAQERALSFRGNAMKFMANSFQRNFMKVSDLENAISMVHSQIWM